MSQKFLGETLVGKQFGKWTVLEFSPSEKPGSYWLCECSCNLKTKKIINGRYLKNGESKSCGCSKRDYKGEDISGNIYGRWKALRRDTSRYDRVYWICECSCNDKTIKSVLGSDLKRGASQSCGCFKRERTSEVRTKDLTGQTFNRITVLEKTDMRNADKRIIYKCRCSCEDKTIFYASGKNMVDGKTQSCGCLQRESNRSRDNKYFHDLTGQIFGLLTAIEKTDKRSSNGNIIWKCKCSCGTKECYASGKDLVVGSTKSCGCLRSIGEYYIWNILKQNNIPYQQQYSFEDLLGINNGLLQFDFAIFNNNKLSYLIEFDGEHHFRPAFGGEKRFIETQKHDKLKNEYCLNNNIPLIRIPYVQRYFIDLSMLDLKTSPYLITKDNINNYTKEFLIL